MNDKTTVNQRFIKSVNHLIETKFAKNKTDIALNLRLSKSKLSEILNERMNVPIDTIAFISLFYGISADWLLNNKGDMFGSKISDFDDKIDDDKVANLEKENKLQAKIIEGMEFKISTLEKQLAEFRYNAQKEPVLYRTVAESAPELIKKESK